MHIFIRRKLAGSFDRGGTWEDVTQGEKGRKQTRE